MQKRKPKLFRIHKFGISLKPRMVNKKYFEPFEVQAKTRPKQCPICRTLNKVTRYNSNQWKCEECGHIWKL